MAFALGVGAAVLGGTAVAQADASGPGARGSNTASSSRDADNGSASAKPASATRAKSRARAAATEKTKAEPAAAADLGSGAADELLAELEPSRPPGRSLLPPAERQAVPAAAEAQPAAAPAAEAVVAPVNRQPALPAAAVAASAQTVGAGPAAAAAPSPFFKSLFDNVKAFFNNQTPTLSYDPIENTVVDGHILGNLHPYDPDSPKLTYTVTEPQFGTVVLNPGGTFDYTPGENFTGQDMFSVTVSDTGNGFHIHGFAGLLNLLSFGLIGTRGDKKTQTVFIGYQTSVIASDLTQPVDFRFLPDGRIVIAEKGGALKVIDQDGAVLPQPLISLSVSKYIEQGVSGIVVDPDFDTNGYIYVAYTTSEVKDRLSRFTVTGNTAAPASEKVLLETAEAVGPNHHGGALAFGTDGKLYWGHGEDGKGANAQDLTNIYGKIMRINPDGSTPSDNPVLPPGALPQIYAYGLRNPFRMTFSPDGQLLVADVGSVNFEELNLVTAGGNYGWPGAEGVCTSNCAGLTDPIYSYPRGGGAAFTSVVVHNDSRLFIADEVQGWIKVLTCDSGFTSCGSPQEFDLSAGKVVAMSEGLGTDDGLYVLTFSPGTLVRIGQTSST